MWDQSIEQPLRVLVSVLPLKTFVEKIGKEHVDVRAMVRPGHNPHTYEPTPRQIAAICRSRALTPASVTLLLVRYNVRRFVKPNK